MIDFQEIMSRLKNCIESGNMLTWQQLIMVEDDVALQSMIKWFEDYFVIHDVEECEIILDDTYNKMSNSDFKCSIKVKYHEYENYSADFLIKTKPDKVDNENKIVDIEQFYLATDKQNLCWHMPIENNEDWWNDSSIDENESEKDNLSCSQLARVITRNIRFREAHIQLECASIMTNMMSAIMPKICSQLNVHHKNMEQKLKYIYGILRNKFRLQITRHDRDNTWASKYLAPWYGIEEIITDKDDGKRIAVSCNSFMSILYSLLRWCGFKVSQLVQFRIVNQDYLIVRCDDHKLFFVSHDNFILCAKRTIYPSGTINRVFGAEWFIDFRSNNAEISSEQIQDYNFIAKNTFLPIYRLTGRESKMMLVTSASFTNNFRYNIFCVRNRIESSIYPWLKYANQTLYVSKPETYIYWSVHSNWGNIRFNNHEEIYKYIKQMGNKSIFFEADRIMTSDQCIRHQRGGKKDMAVFLFSAFKKFLDGQGCIIFTKKYEYVVYHVYKSHKRMIYNVGLQQEANLIEGEILLVFNHINSYYPMRDKNHINRIMFKEIIGEITEQEIL